ncbi:hypothetical protein SH580_03965 [Coraliomargarita algicola]|uniref:Uncharacterized protein n=1 Tax=Coraliomargarita algicola TaxID=3092156 RepID=A0ABZ0RP00_9BACT|nr:hypothetical protein [Coraliomargarita sp. J2-16]WPJ96861.1 hypothetical protein SH580_03965 [Coraliomargarita sp. J2-16]
MKRAFKLAGISLFVWGVTLVPVYIVATFIVNSMNPEAVEFRQGKTTSISSPRMLIYSTQKSEFMKLAMITSLVISQTAVVASVFSKQDESKW